MAANTNPRYTLTGDPSSNNSTTMAPTFTTAAADYDGTSANNKQVWLAGSNGGRIAGLRFKAIGNNIASVARIYTNNGSAHTSAANNSFVGEVSLPPTTGVANASTIDLDYYFPGGYLDLPNAFALFVGLGTTVASGWVVTPILGGQF